MKGSTTYGSRAGCIDSFATGKLPSGIEARLCRLYDAVKAAPFHYRLKRTRYRKLFFGIPGAHME
jgi:hypothetical protein